MVDRVVVESRTGEELHLRIEWADGMTPEMRVVDLHTKTLRRIREMHDAGVDAGRIASQLANEGIRTLRNGAEWTAARVLRTLYRRSLRTNFNRKT